MKVGILVQDITFLGGVEVVSVWLANKLSETHDVEIISCRGDSSKELEISKSVKISYLNLQENPKKNNKADYLLFKNFFSTRKFDIIILQAGSAIRKCCCLSDKKLCKIIANYSKLYYVLHGSPKYHLKRYNTDYDPFFMFFLKKIYHKIRYACGVKCFFYLAKKYVKQFVTLSKGCQEELYSCYGLRSIVMYNPYSFDRVHIDMKDKCNELIYAGRLSPEKDIRLILDSWHLVSNKSNWILKIIGTGSQETLLKKYVREKKIKNVVFLEAVPHKVLVNILVKSKILLLTSFFEGFPTIISEALNYKNVPIVTKYEGFSSELLKEDCAFICNRNPKYMSQVIQQLIKDNELIDLYAEKGYNRCMSFYEKLEEINYNLEEYR